MKMTLAVLIVALGSAYALSAGPAVNCSDRAVDGYHLGMTSDEAVAVRGGERKPDGVILAHDPGKEMTLKFDQAGHLREVEVNLAEVDPGVLRGSLAATWGAENKDDHEKPTAAGVEPRVTRSAWTDATCQQSLEVFFTYGPGGTRARVHVKRISE